MHELRRLGDGSRRDVCGRGGGIRGGVVYGTSDKQAGYPVDQPTSPADLAATVFHALGIDPETRIADTQGRPVSLVEGGQPLRALFA